MGDIEGDDGCRLGVSRAHPLGVVGNAGRVVFGVVTGELGERGLDPDGLGFHQLSLVYCWILYTHLIDDLTVHLTVLLGVLVLGK